jgi:hypothetical protein
MNSGSWEFQTSIPQASRKLAAIIISADIDLKNLQPLTSKRSQDKLVNRELQPNMVTAVMKLSLGSCIEWIKNLGSSQKSQGRLSGGSDF